MESTQHRRDDQWKERVADDAYRLKERAGESCQQYSQSLIPKYTCMFPPRSLICVVTTASPIQTSAKTPEKTAVFCLLDAVIDRSKLRSRQNINGPLYPCLGGLAQPAARTSLGMDLPKIPVPQAFGHATLEYRISVRPPSSDTPKTSCKTISLAPFCASDASTSLQHSS